MPTHPKIQQITLPGGSGDIAALKLGLPSGANALALHGWLDNAASFVPLAAHLTQLNLLAMDFAGHGRAAPRPPGCGYHLTDYVRDIHAVAQALDWPRFDLLGHSLGAGIACLYAAALPQRVRRLVLIDGLGPLSAQPRAAPAQLAKSLQAQSDLQAKLTQPRRRYATWQQLISARQRAGEMLATSAELLVRRAAKQQADGIVMQSDARLKMPSPLYLSEPQVRAFIRAIRCPVLLIQAENGLLRKRPELQARIKLFRDIRVQTVAGNHHVHLDRPQAVAEPINRFLQEQY